MIVCFQVMEEDFLWKDDTLSLKDFEKLTIKRFKENLPEPIKVFFIQDIKFVSLKPDSLGRTLCIVYLKFGINFLPKFFFSLVLKKSLRKYGYLGEYRSVSYKEALEHIIDGGVLS